MAELRYHDRPLSPFPGMGASFSDAVIGLQRLKLQEQQRQQEQYYRNIELGMQGQKLGIERERLGYEKQKHELDISKEKMLMDAAKEYSQAIKGLYKPKFRDVGPPIPPEMEQAERERNIQVAMGALGLSQFQSPTAAGKAMEPQQFSRGPVYGPMDTARQGQAEVQPMFNVPAPPESDRERAMRGMAMRNASLRAFDAKQRHAVALMNVLERIRHDKASRSEQGGGANELLEYMRKKEGGTNAPRKRITVTPLD